MTYFEIIGLLSAFFYLYFSIKQNILLWPLGIITSAASIYVFYVSKVYADMALQIYYMVISFYGWYYWIYGKKKSDNILPVTKLNSNSWILLILTNIIIFIIIAFLLKRFTNSDVPFLDAFTTSTSIIATWMLTKKKIENWILWIVVDSISSGLYWYKGLHIYVVLYIVYTVMAFVGYYQWKKSMNIHS